LWTILLRGSPLRPYNVGSEQPRTIGDLARAVAAQYGCGVEMAQAPRAGAPVDRYVPSTARARGELGLSETIGFEEAVARTVGWYRARGTAHVTH
jgi:nucleoside-diphosphate-sugar epimerase